MRNCPPDAAGRGHSGGLGAEGDAELLSTSLLLPREGLAHPSLPGQPEQVSVLEIWLNVLPSSLAQRIRGHVCWAKPSTCVLDPKASLSRTRFPPWQPCLSSVGCLTSTAAEVQQQRELRYGIRRLGIKSVSGSYHMHDSRWVSHLAELPFPYLETGFLKTMNSAFSQIWFLTASPLATSALSGPVSCL